MSGGTDLAGAIAADARLFILRELAGQVDGHLNAISLRRVLEIRYGINRSPEWVETQLHALRELGVIELSAGGQIIIAHILPLGRHFLAERSVVAGITLPSDVE
ncbi:MAG: hypothetical protein J0I69_02815 [Altererythrobacter sp.]|nr:hypothetical protein [Altererythrobacter sp.]OJU60950.1 MAG: hypothetical protein BGO08_12555 [Altererythrobacter sp. 66-12]